MVLMLCYCQNYLKKNIVTIDLPENDEDFVNFYDRKKKVNKFIQDRDNILSKNEDIKFFTLNSLKLLNHKKV